jgi:hypothetical protein
MSPANKTVLQSVRPPRKYRRPSSQLGEDSQAQLQPYVGRTHRKRHRGGEAQTEFFELAERFRNSTDPEEAKRLGDELGRMVFGT